MQFKEHLADLAEIKLQLNTQGHIVVRFNINNIEKVLNIIDEGNGLSDYTFILRNVVRRFEELATTVNEELENTINKIEILKRLKKRKGFNPRLLKKFKKIQLPLDYKKKKSDFIIKNNFNKLRIKKDISDILKKIL